MWLTLDFFHFLYVSFRRDAYCTAKVQSVYSALVVHDHHDIIGSFVIYEQLPLTVKDQAS